MSGALAVTGTCRGCAAPMAWGRDGKTGKPRPLDPAPADRGNVRIESYESDGTPVVRIIGKDRAEQARLRGETLYQLHFVTCPDRDRFRKKGGGGHG